jgi:hypothetical protein
MGANMTANNEYVPWDKEDEYWAQLEEQEDVVGSNPADGDDERRRKRRRRAGERTFALRRIVSIKKY